MKKIIISSLIILTSIITKAQTIQVYGTYSHYVISMCSQGCEFTLVGPFLIPDQIQFKNDESISFNQTKTVLVSGQFVQKEKPITLAGPKADYSRQGETYKTEMLEIKTFKELNFYEARLDEKNIKLFKDGKDYTIEIKLSNKFDQDLALKMQIEDGNTINFELKKEQTKKLKYLIKNNGYTSRVKLFVSNQSITSENIKQDAKKIAEQGKLVLFLEEYIDIDALKK